MAAKAGPKYIPTATFNTYANRTYGQTYKPLYLYYKPMKNYGRLYFSKKFKEEYDDNYGWNFYYMKGSYYKFA